MADKAWQRSAPKLADALPESTVELVDDLEVSDATIVGEVTTVDDAIDAALSGDRNGTDRALRRLAAEGEAPVRVVRGLAPHLLRLVGVQARVDAGEPLEAALRSLRPPLFFKREPMFRRQMQIWRGERLAKALARATETELRCKETGQPDRLICERLFVELSAQSARSGSATKH